MKLNAPNSSLDRAFLDNYAEDGGPGVAWLLCSFYHKPLCSLIVKVGHELCDLTSNWFQIGGRDSVKPFEAVLSILAL